MGMKRKAESGKQKAEKKMQMSVALAQFQLSTFRFHLFLILLHDQRRGETPLPYLTRRRKRHR
jgi:hypothetical protein